MNRFLHPLFGLIITTSTNAYAIGTGGIGVAYSIILPLIGLSVLTMLIASYFWIKLTLHNLKSKSSSFYRLKLYIFLTLLLVSVSGFSAFMFVQIAYYFLPITIFAGAIGVNTIYTSVTRVNNNECT